MKEPEGKRMTLKISINVGGVPSSYYILNIFRILSSWIPCRKETNIQHSVEGLILAHSDPVSGLKGSQVFFLIRSWSTNRRAAGDFCFLSRWWVKTPTTSTHRENFFMSTSAASVEVVSVEEEKSRPLGGLLGVSGFFFRHVSVVDVHLPAAETPEKVENLGT